MLIWDWAKGVWQGKLRFLLYWITWGREITQEPALGSENKELEGKKVITKLYTDSEETKTADSEEI